MITNGIPMYNKWLSMKHLYINGIPMYNKWLSMKHLYINKIPMHFYFENLISPPVKSTGTSR